MCGICGQYNFLSNAPADGGTIKRMMDSIAHRGPDDAGYYHSRWAPAGSRRDLSAAQRNAPLTGRPR